MNEREHASLARELIDACGGLAEASIECGVSKTLLSTYQNPNHPAYMTARVMADLEAYCGQPIYSGAMVARFNALSTHGNVADAAACVTEEAADAQSVARHAGADGFYTPAELACIEKEVREVEQRLQELRGALRGSNSITPLPGLRAV